MRFADPWLFALLLPVILALWWGVRARRRVTLLHPGLPGLVRRGLKPGRMVRWRWLPTALRLLALVLLVAALARPQAGVATGVVTEHGVDILVALDISGSMAAEDFSPNRMAVAKQVVAEFIGGRPHDRVGLVVFAAEAYTQVPLTLDHHVALALLEQVRIGLVEDGTAIGTALATAVGRLKDSDADSRVVVLLTDGNNNAGEIDPLSAAKLAAELGIRVYTVGVGSKEPFVQMRDMPFVGQVPVTMRSDMDEGLLKEVAAATGGQFFRAKNADSLREIYARIDSLEKSEFESNTYLNYHDRYLPLLGFGALLLLIEWLLTATRLRRLPG
jgi:Ca-activated chloride channel family protein